jgi:hypothetical protein
MEPECLLLWSQEPIIAMYLLNSVHTEYRCRVINNISARRPAILTEVFHIFSQSVQTNSETVAYLKLGHEHFLPVRFQFTIHLSLFHWTLYRVSEDRL